MARKTILVDIYLAANLGDDMFLDHLSYSFPDIDFVPFHPGRNYTSFFKNYNNIKPFSYSWLDKALARMGRNKLNDYNQLSKDFDGMLFLGGGIFREESYWQQVYSYRLRITRAFKEQGKKVFFSGCNFGPYTSDKFLNAQLELFNEVDQITFRDKSSFKLFTNVVTVKYAPDVLWSYDLPTVTKKEKRLGISVIDPRHKKQSQKIYEDYVETHIKLCRNYIQKGYEIVLFSFCEKEGDLTIAKEIAQDLPKVKIENYEMDIDAFLHKVGSCSLFLGARFHAVIIAFKYDIPIIPIIYGDKTENLLLDLKFEEPFIYLNTIDSLLEAEFLHISDEKKELFLRESKRHFAINF